MKTLEEAAKLAADAFAESSQDVADLARHVACRVGHLATTEFTLFWSPSHWMVWQSH